LSTVLDLLKERPAGRAPTCMVVVAARNRAISYAWRERHCDCDLTVAPRGATPAFCGSAASSVAPRETKRYSWKASRPSRWRGRFTSRVHGAGRLFGRKGANQQLSRAE
jgi:tRNA-splicing ligase RtcB (3'-phosphate/5'-hydroxy nucleic acid ligase)